MEVNVFFGTYLELYLLWVVFRAKNHNFAIEFLVRTDIERTNLVLELYFEHDFHVVQQVVLVFCLKLHREKGQLVRLYQRK